MMKFKLIAPLLILCISFSCEKKCRDQYETSNISLKTKVYRLENEIDNIKDTNDILMFKNNFQPYFKFNEAAGIPDIEVKKQIYWLATQPIDTLISDVKRQFGNFEQEKEIKQLFKNIKSNFPKFKEPDIYTFVSAFGGYVIEDADSVIIIGLDYFLDSTARYAPPKDMFPDYLKKQFHPKSVVTKLALAISERFSPSTPNPKLIAQMVAYGKRYYWMYKMLPCATTNEILGYDENQWAEIQSNSKTIYGYFAKNELFYNNRAENLRLFVGERPTCLEIGDKCPGMIGRWLGFEIVKSYIEKNNLSLEELMKEQDLEKIFVKSGYKGIE